MVKNSGSLSHHEELRLDYLRKNIHYLNEKEQHELAYLELKLEHGVPAAPSRGNASRPVKVSRRKPAINDDYVDDLPDYRADHTPSRKKSRQKAKRTFSDPVVEELPVYGSREVTYADELPEQSSLEPYPQEKRKKKEKKPRKKRKGRIKRFFQFVAFLLFCVVAGMAFMFYRGYTNPVGDDSTDSTAAQSEVFNGEDTADGVNILVMGTDGRVGETSGMTRTDSIMVVNINNSDNTIKIVSFMRDTLVNIGGNDYKLNTVYTLGEQNGNQGAENVRQVLKENFDIDIKHYALVDFSTFATAIDTLFPEGVTINAEFSTINGETVSSVEVPDDLNMDENGNVPTQTIQVGEQQMDGRTLLNYARFRKDDEGDYGRTKRQQQVLAAIMTQVKNPTKLFTGAEAIGEVFSLTSTSVPFSFILGNGISVIADAGEGIEQVTIPANNDWEDGYDIYGGSGLQIDFEKYKAQLAELGLR